MDASIDRKADEILVGFMGHYPPTPTYEKQARDFIFDSYTGIDAAFPDKKKALISCASSRLLLAIAYSEAEKRGWRIIPTDESQTPTFLSIGSRPKYLDDLDVLIRIGGEFRSQYTEEAKAAGKLVFERYMPFLLGGG